VPFRCGRNATEAVPYKRRGVVDKMRNLLAVLASVGAALPW